MTLECQQKCPDCSGDLVVVQLDQENAICLCEKHLEEYDSPGAKP